MFLHCDLDSFYVSVERAKNPKLKGQIIAVGGNKYGKGVIASASYEARRCNIHAGMSVYEAKKICSALLLINPNFNLYQSFSEKFFKLLYSLTPDFEKASIDEAYVDFSHTAIYYKTPLNLAKIIKEKTKKLLHLPVSIGIGSNKYLAKIASKYAKPNGIYQIENEIEFIQKLPVNIIPGIGKKLTYQLQLVGINRVGDILNFPLSFWKEQFNQTGEWLYNLAQNTLQEHIEKNKKQKSIGHSETFPYNLDYKHTLIYLRTIANILGYKMRKKHLFGTTISLKVRYDNFATFTNQYSFAIPTNFSDMIYSYAKELFKKHKNYEGKFRLIGIIMSNLISKNGGIQLDFFSKKSFEQKKNLYQAIDCIYDKWGTKIIL